MKTGIRTLVLALTFSGALLFSTHPAPAAIESNFDDGIYPGGPGDGWAGGWQHTIGTPEFRTNAPLPGLTGTTPYIHLEAVGGSYRNFMRQMTHGAGVNLAAPHYLRWKFRLAETDFDTNFTGANDRVHFFGRTAARLAGSTDASVNWMIYATGAAGAVGGDKMFWLCDNWNGSGAFDANTAVNTGVPLVPFHVYAFELFIVPDQQTFTLSIVDESTNNATFTSSAPHKFRNLAAAPDSFTFLHFGTQASATSEVRPFDLDSVSITPWGGPAFASVTPNAYAIHPAAEGIRYDVTALNPVATGSIGLTLNGSNMTAQLIITGSETNRSVAFSGLAADTMYQMTLHATNASGTASMTRTFYTATKPFSLYNADGFTNDTLYPPGPLQPVSHGNATWVPSTEPSEIVDLADGHYGKVLQRMNMGVSRTDYLQFPPVSSGTITVEFDARVSTTTGRTFDLALMTASGSWASHVAWGAVSEKLACYSSTLGDWQPVGDLPPDWHHCKIVHYLSGAAAGRYDLLVNGTPVADKVQWRNATPGQPLSQISYQAHSSGVLMAYGQLDNLVVTAAPEDPNAFPPPSITNLSPAAYAVVRPADGLRFEVTSVLPVTASDISVTLNGVKVTSGLTATGSVNHLFVSCGPLSPGLQFLEITATNGAGATVLARSFYATETSLTLFDANGFADDTLYPVGLLQAVTNNGSRWVPAVAPNSGEIVDLADGQHGKVLRRQQLGGNFHDYLLFPPVSSGVVEIELDARMAAMTARVVDISLNSVTAAGGGTQGPFIMWATNTLYYYNGAAWVSVSPYDAAWHRVKLTCYVSGARAGKFDLKVDDTLVGRDLVWRNVFSPVGTLRFGTQNSGAAPGEYGELDNIVIRVAPEPIAALPVALLHPNRTGSTFAFSFQSLAGFTYVAQANGSFDPANWTTLDTVAGDGSPKTIVHTNPPAGPMFYRVKTGIP